MTDCRRCFVDHRVICETTGKMCAMAEDYANGRVKRSERIAKPEMTEHVPQDSYDEALWVLMRDKEARDSERLEAIRSIDGRIPTLCRKKAILSMMFCEMTQDQIGEVMRVSRQRISIISRLVIGKVK